MAETVEVQIEDMEFQLESDSELRFEVENKNETVVLEVRINNKCILLSSLIKMN